MFFSKQKMKNIVSQMTRSGLNLARTILNTLKTTNREQVERLYKRRLKVSSSLSVAWTHSLTSVSIKCFVCVGFSPSFVQAFIFLYYYFIFLIPIFLGFISLTAYYYIMFGP